MKKHTLRKLFVAAAFTVAGSSAALAQGTIYTIAGTGTAGLSGDGGAAIDARLSQPHGVATDGEGNVYIADKNNNRIRKISGGTITSVAGAGVAGWGTGIPGLHYPSSVFADAGGEVLFTGWFNDMGFAYDPATGTTAARYGCGSQGSSGDGGPACLAKTMTPTGSCEDIFGNTYVADYGSNRIRRVDATTGIITTIVNGGGTHGYSGDGGLAISARTSNPSAVFFDPSSPGAGHLYFSDANNNVVRMVDLNTGIISTVAGTGTAGFSGNFVLANTAQLRNPGSLFIAPNGMMYICDRGNNAVRQMHLVRKVISTVAGTGVAGFSGDGDISTSAQLSNPQGVWADAAGYIYIADAGNNRVRKIAPTGAPVTPRGNVGNMATQVTLYPNPANGVVNIATGADMVDATYTVYTVTGAQVLNGSISGTTGTVSLAGLAAGTYSIRLQSGSNEVTEKIIVQ